MWNMLLLVIAVLTAAYYWLKNSITTYWDRRNVVNIKPVPIFGNFMPALTFKKNFAQNMQDLYNDPSVQNEPIIGVHLLNEPTLLLRSPEIIKNVLNRDFNCFPNRFESCHPQEDPLGYYNLFFVKPPSWRNVRTKLTPVFTSIKLKQMYPLMLEICKKLEQHLEQQTSNTKEKGVVLELKELSALFTTDVIASVAFGIQANSLENPNGGFRRNGRKALTFSISRALEVFIILFKPSLINVFKPKFFSKEFSDFLRSSILHVMDERRQSGRNRNDLIDILLAMKNESGTDQSTEITQDYLVAQAAVFLTAGFETSASTIAFALYELAKRPDLQQNLRNEIHKEFSAGNAYISYEKIQEMEYLDMVVSETLRMYPPLPFLDRQCILPDEQSTYSLRPHHDFAVPHKMPLYIPIYAIQRDPKYWPEPNTFDPNRFSAANKKSQNIMPVLSFGAGPRNCIGMRMGLLQAKLGLIHVLRNHNVRTCDSTPLELKFDKKSFLLSSAGGLYMNIVNDTESQNV